MHVKIINLINIQKFFKWFLAGASFANSCSAATDIFSTISSAPKYGGLVVSSAFAKFTTASCTSPGVRNARASTAATADTERAKGSVGWGSHFIVA